MMSTDFMVFGGVTKFWLDGLVEDIICLLSISKVWDGCCCYW